MEYKLAYVVIVCYLLVHMSWIGTDVVFFHTTSEDGVLIYLFSQAVAYLLFPLLGWLADVYFTRYKFILFSIITMIVTTVVMVTAATLFMIYTYARPLYMIAGVGLIIGLLGLGLFESTAIQFGMDQMLEASSDQLSTFIHWYYWSSNIGPVIVVVMSAGVLQYYSQCTIKLTDIQHPDELYETLHPYYYTIMCTAIIFMVTLQLVCACVGLCLLVKYKKHFNIDQTGEHPLKLIYQVLKYAMKHECPENRSAFTYWEEDIPPHIDLGIHPSNVHLFPSNVHLFPSNRHLSPSKIHLSPSNIHLSPSNIHLSPSNIHLSPSNIHLSPSNIHLFPSCSLAIYTCLLAIYTCSLAVP